MMIRIADKFFDDKKQALSELAFAHYPVTVAVLAPPSAADTDLHLADNARSAAADTALQQESNTPSDNTATVRLNETTADSSATPAALLADISAADCSVAEEHIFSDFDSARVFVTALKL